MSLHRPVATVERSACSTIAPSGSTRSTRRDSIATTSRRPSGSQPSPLGKSSSSSSTLRTPSSPTLDTVCWWKSENQSRPSCQRGPSPKSDAAHEHGESGHATSLRLYSHAHACCRAERRPRARGQPTSPIRRPGPGELVLEVTACGICGSDLKLRPSMPAGLVMGHEFCGEIVATGADTDPAWRVGRHVTALPLIGCGRCLACLAGEPAHCEQADLVGVGGSPGAFAEYVRVDQRETVALPESLDPDARCAGRAAGRRAARGRARPHPVGRQGARRRRRAGRSLGDRVGGAERRRRARRLRPVARPSRRRRAVRRDPHRRPRGRATRGPLRRGDRVRRASRHDRRVRRRGRRSTGRS